MVERHKTFFAFVFILLLFTAGCAGPTVGVRDIEDTDTQKVSAPSASPLTSRAKRFKIFEEVEYRVLAKSYYFSDSDTAKREAFVACMERHKVAKNDDPTHTSELNEVLNECNPEDARDAYLTPILWRESAISDGASFSGIGVQVSWNEEKTGLLIEYIFPGSSLEGMGIRVGDVIMSMRQRDEAELQKVEGGDMGDIVRKIRGPKGTKVFLEIWRDGKRLGIFAAERKDVDPRIVITKTFERGKVGYIKFAGFDNNIFQEKLYPAISSFYTQGIRKIIFDMRGNPGGRLSEALAISAIFMDPSALVLKVCGREGCEEYRTSGNHRSYFRSMAVVILVDKNSASASELVAGALQFHKKAFIIGEKTYGKGSVQVQEGLQAAPGSGLRMTIAKFYFDDAQTLTPENGGVLPDLVIPSATNRLGVDTQLEAALYYFRLMERNDRHQ